jgi:hypothetical protein
LLEDGDVPKERVREILRGLIENLKLHPDVCSF